MHSLCQSVSVPVELHSVNVNEISNSSASTYFVLNAEPVSWVSLFSAATKIQPRERDEPRVIKLHFCTLLGNVCVEDNLLF